MNIEPSKREIKNLELVKSKLHECCLFLRKNDAFPLQKPCKIALFGNGARHTIKGGTGSGDVNSHFVINAEEGLLRSGFQITTFNWLNEYEKVLKHNNKQFVKDIRKSAKEKHVSVYMEAFGYVRLEKEYNLPLSFDADACVYVLSRLSGEGNDRIEDKGDIYLTETEIRDILLLNSKYEKFILVLNVGGMVDLTPVLKVNNILLLSQLGSNIGLTLADIILGKVNPSGKLTDTWAPPSDYLKAVNFGDVNNTYYLEGLYVGYRYFDSYRIKPTFPFGFGLSYSEFKILNPKVNVKESIVNVDFEVINTSKYIGKEVVQLYMSEPQGKLGKTYQKLVGFIKTANLKENESKNYDISFDLCDFASYDTSSSSYVLEKGQYILRLGNNSRDTIVVGAIKIEEDIIVRKVNNLYNKTIDFNAINIDDNIVKNPIKTRIKIENIEHYNNIYSINENADKYSNGDLINLLLGSQRGDGLSSFIGESSMKVKGAAGESYSGIEGLKTYVMADGPAGLRLSPKVAIGKKDKLRDLSANYFMTQLIDFFPLISRPILSRFTHEKKLKRSEKILYQYATSLPIGTALAQSWNLEYAKLCGDVVGSEMEEFGVHFWLAPGMNIHRYVRCGRNFEYYSEDPLLTGLIASSITNGVQSHKGRYVTLKHFACNNQETNRFFSNSIVNERVLREIYLKPFEIAIRLSNPGAIMSSYNLINGRHTNESKELIYDYLRREVGFEGIVMTDWILSSTEPMNGTTNPATNVVNVVKAKNQLFMPGSDKDYFELLTSLDNGLINRKDLIEAVSPFLNFIEKDN